MYFVSLTIGNDNPTDFFPKRDFVKVGKYIENQVSCFTFGTMLYN